MQQFALLCQGELATAFPGYKCSYCQMFCAHTAQGCAHNKQRVLLTCKGCPSNNFVSLKLTLEWSATVEILQKSVCPNMVIGPKLTNLCHVSQSIISIFLATESLQVVLPLIIPICLAHSGDMSLVIAPVPALMASAGTTNN